MKFIEYYQISEELSNMKYFIGIGQDTAHYLHDVHSDSIKYEIVCFDVFYDKIYDDLFVYAITRP